MATLEHRTVRPGDFPAARRIIATAFAGERFSVGMFGPDPTDRLVGMMHEYEEWPWESGHIATGAYLDDVLVGATRASLPGACGLCLESPVAPAESAAVSAHVEYEFLSICRRVHLDCDLPDDHAHVGTVATDAFLRGAGIGAALVQATLQRLWDLDASCVVLECLTSREAFYSRLGFEMLVEFDDPGGPGLRAVLMRLDRGAVRAS